jgi:acyl-CoA reductase-like NAD-dependent aldehyde dehydrogenase
LNDRMPEGFGFPETPTTYADQIADTKLTEVSKPASKKQLSRRDLEAALDALKPAETAPPTPAEKERARRLNRVNALVLAFSTDLKSLGFLETRDLAKAEAAIRALGTVAKSASAAIEAIPDSRLVDEPKPERKPRAPKEPTGAAVLAPEPEAAPETAADLAYGDEGETAEPSDDGTGF